MIPVAGEAQSMFPNQRDDSYPLLGLKRAKSVYEQTKSEFERKQQLYDRQLISQQELEQTKTAYLDAEVNFQQSLLVLLFENQFVSVSKALKIRDENGRNYVDITLENTSGVPVEFKQLVDASSEELVSSLDLQSIYNVYVSLSNEDGAIISIPYEQKLNALKAGKPATVRFQLLQDVDALTVNLIFGNGSTRNPKVYLQKDATADRLLIQSDQFAQEVELDGNTKYGLNLELFSNSTSAYRLEVANLPGIVTSYFSDPATEARMSQIKFNESSNTRRADLEIYLPDRASDELRIDSAITFFVAAIPQTNQELARELRSGIWTESDLQELNIGYTRLEMIPRGTGELIVKAPQLYHNAKPGSVIQTEMILRNDGTQDLSNIEFEIDGPFGWKQTIEPDLVRRLKVRDEIPVMLNIETRDDMPVGKYEVRVKTTAMSNNQPLSADTKLFTIEITAEAGMTGTILLIFGILLSGGLIIWFGRKLSNK